MSDQTPPDPVAETPAEVPAPPAYQPPPPVAAPPYGAPVPQMYGPGPVGKVRSTGVCMLLFVVTLGFYGWYWFFQTHDEMKRHTGRGIGGGVALVLCVASIFVGVTLWVLPFFTSSEVGEMRKLGGKEPRVSGVTGLWYFPGFLLIVLPIVWFVKTNGALNDYWKSMGAPA